jgi:hypothetical protein
MRFRDKIGPLHHPIPKPANLPDFLAVARINRNLALPVVPVALPRERLPISEKGLKYGKNDKY